MKRALVAAWFGFVSVTSVSLGGAPARAAPLELTVVPGSGAVRFVIEAPLDSIAGSSRAVSGKATLDPNAWASARARIDVDLASFRTGIALRDEDLRDQFFETARYTQATLNVSRFERTSSASLSIGTPTDAVAVGTLTLHGVVLPMQVPVQVTMVDERTIMVTGTMSVKLSDFQIERPSRLFLKLGSEAEVTVRATLKSAAPVTSPPPAVAAAPPEAGDPAKGALPVDGRGPAKVRPAAPDPFKETMSVAHIPKKRPAPSQYRFAATTSEGRGERLFADPSVGGDGNAMTCTACHASRDERAGVLDKGTYPPSQTVYNSAKRAKLWQGFASTPAEASTMCAKMYMLRTDELPKRDAADLQAFLTKISPDPAPELDYRVLFTTKKSPLANPLGGDAKRGAKLEAIQCGRCHGVGKVRPSLTPGLYEASYLVARVRWLQGHDAQQMPPMYVTRLPDSELRDIVTYLVDEQHAIFKRKPKAPAAPAIDAAKKN